ncbi:CHC2 zinc finger domain-containing protein [Nitrospira sp. Nam74]
MTTVAADAQKTRRQFRVDKGAVLRGINADAFFKESLLGYRVTGPTKAVAHCIFHEDHRPSLHIDLNRRLFHCFGCGVGGDLFSFVMQRDGVCFPQAVEILARYAGLGIVPTPSSDMQAAIGARKLAARRRDEERRYTAEIRTAIDCSMDELREADRLIRVARDMSIFAWSESDLDEIIDNVAVAHLILERDIL